MEVAAAAIGLLDATIRTIKALKKTYARVKDAPEILDRFSTELKATKNIIEVVDDEDSLHTKPILIELQRIKEVEKKLKSSLQEMVKDIAKRPVTQMACQLFKGSSDEKKLSGLMDELRSVKLSLCTQIQVTSVGVMRDLNNKLVAKLDVIEEVNKALVKVMGQSGSLRIKDLLANRKPRGEMIALAEARHTNAWLEDGCIVLSPEDINFLEGRDTGKTKEDKSRKERIVVGNVSKDLAVMINVTPAGTRSSSSSLRRNGSEESSIGECYWGEII